ncbi:MAG: insulinase family protein [Bryobacterales bacterium]|nr:insulinase family protein [Bryobacterales bacterium]
MRFLVLLAAAWTALAASKLPPIKFSDTKLDNGLRVIVSEDHAAPVFAICVAYSVGSKDERPGRTGFAHLFEHMMFKGSENVGSGEHFYLIFNNGGSMNGTTNKDRTNYFETLPKNQLDLALFLESDRMRSLAITKENLENQRQAVKEERRMRVDNQPYGQTFERGDEMLYTNFAYKHSVIGSMADLDAATVDDVRDFFKTYYAPNNATVVLVGDLDTKTTLEKVKKYFGDIPRQEAPKPVDLSDPPQKEAQRDTINDRFARLPRIDLMYKIPPASEDDFYALYMLGSILGRGESSRLYQTLVKDKEAAVQVASFARPAKGPGIFSVIALTRPGKRPEEVDGLLSEEISRLMSAPVAAQELERARARMRRDAIETRLSVQRRANEIADNVALFGDPNLINTELDKLLAVTPEQMQKAAQKYLVSSAKVVITTTPAAPAQRKKKQ